MTMAAELTGALAGLRPFTLADLPAYKRALDTGGRICWQQYFPFLYFYYAMNGAEDLLLEEVDGSLCVYRLKHRGQTPSLCLYFLPLPMNGGVLRHCLERVRAFNGGGRAMIYWVDAEDVGCLAGLWDSLRIFPMNQEYLYDPKLYRDLSGRRTKELRHNLNRIAARGDVTVRPFANDDAEDCIALMDEWAEQQRQKYEAIAYRRYTKNCVRHAGLFAAPDLIGKVVLIDGRIRAFGFAGEIRRDLANLFVTYSDLVINGLNRFLIYQLLRDLDGCDIVNSAMADTPGLAAAKASLCPVAMHGMFRVHVGEEG